MTTKMKASESYSNYWEDNKKIKEKLNNVVVRLTAEVGSLKSWFVSKFKKIKISKPLKSLKFYSAYVLIYGTSLEFMLYSILNLTFNPIRAIGLGLLFYFLSNESPVIFHKHYKGDRK